MPAVEKGFQEQMRDGMLVGANITGMRVVVNDGGFHPVDSSDMAFKTCAKTALREHYKQANPVILEPIESRY